MTLCTLLDRLPVHARLLAAVLLLPALGVASDEPVTFATCRQMVAEDPHRLDGYLCFQAVARGNGRFAAANRALEQYLDADPANHRARLALDLALLHQGQAQAADHLHRAAEGFATTGEARGEVIARIALHTMLRWRGEHAEHLLTSFYEALTRGKTVAGALADAQRRCDAEGRPAAAWSGFTVLGDGALQPFASRSESVPSPVPWLACGGLFLVAALVLALRHRRRTAAAQYSTP